MVKEYLVVKRAARWWVICEGAALGPYVSQKVAQDAAVGMAKVDFRAGIHARVTVDDSDGEMPVIYDSAAP